MNVFASLEEAMVASAAQAVEIAAQGKISLDYSVESLRIVEQQLASLHSAIPRGFLARLKYKGPSDTEMHYIAMTLGAYVGEVLRRHLGGHWSEENSLEPGTKIPTLHLGGVESWPQLKVEKRLKNGPEDNVWQYSQMLIEQLKGSSAGDA